jgi:3-phosphoshikimate 1-carboxyvinyltransferase
MLRNLSDEVYSGSLIGYFARLLVAEAPAPGVACHAVPASCDRRRSMGGPASPPLLIHESALSQSAESPATASAAALNFKIAPGGSLRGRLRVPGDKSISHRAIMLAAIADGETEVSGFLEGADSLATLAAFRAMGVMIEGPDQGRVRIAGVGLQGLREPAGPLDMGNSGTSMRLLCGLLSGQRFPSTLIGDASLSGRPMRRVTTPLGSMGARIRTSAQGTAPLHIAPAAQLVGIDYAMPMASAQVKSSLLLAGLYADGDTCVSEPAPTRDHTERMLSALGYAVRRDGDRVCLTGGGRLHAAPIAVPADISSAAFFLVGASIAPGSDLTLEQVGINPTRIGVINILREMGADLRVEHQRELGGEPVADIRVRAAALRGIEIPVDQVPLAIDEFPALFIAAACARGRDPAHRRRGAAGQGERPHRGDGGGARDARGAGRGAGGRYPHPGPWWRGGGVPRRVCV